MSLAALADDLNNINRKYVSGVIDYLQFIDLFNFHNKCYQNEIKRREHAQQL